MIDSVHRRSVRCLQWRCGYIPEVKYLCALFSDENTRIFFTLRREGLLEHFINVRPTALRSGVSFAPKGVRRDDADVILIIL